MKGNLGRVGKRLRFNDLGTHGGHISIGELSQFSLEFGEDGENAYPNLESAVTGYGHGRNGRPNWETAWRPITVPYTFRPTSAGTADPTYNFSVTEVDFTVTTAGNKYLWLLHNLCMEGNYPWANDIAIAGIQILDKDDNIVDSIDTVFDSSVTTQKFKTHTSNISTAFPAVTSLQSGNTGWTSGLVDMQVRSTSSLSYRWSYGTDTPSSYTGAGNSINGVADAFEDVLMPVGQFTMAQQYYGSSGESNSHLNTFSNKSTYIYPEASSRSHNRKVLMRTTNQLSIPKEGRIRVAYLNATPTDQASTGADASDNLYGIFSS